MSAKKDNATVSPARKGAVVGAVVGAGLRLLFFAAVAIDAHFEPEAHMLALLDLPTMGVYALGAYVGISVQIVDAFDVPFLLVGVVVWTILGWLIGWFVGWRFFKVTV